jgi:hypothetical protein
MTFINSPAVAQHDDHGRRVDGDDDAGRVAQPARHYAGSPTEHTASVNSAVSRGTTPTVAH